MKLKIKLLNKKIKILKIKLKIYNNKMKLIKTLKKKNNYYFC